MTQQAKNYLTISQFAKLSHITRANLIYYDQQEILQPVKRDEETAYRYYDIRQLDQAYVITFLRKMGVSIKEIRSYMKENVISHTKQLIDLHLHRIQEEINDLKIMQFNIRTYSQNIEEIQQLSIPCFRIEELPSYQLNISPNLSELESQASIDTIHDFFQLCSQQKIDYHGHLGRLFLSPSFEKPDHIFFRTRVNGNYQTPPGTYLVYYTYTDGSDLEAIYQTIQEKIQENQFKIAGPTFEDYPLMGIALHKDNTHLIRIAVQIKATP